MFTVTTLSQRANHLVLRCSAQLPVSCESLFALGKSWGRRPERVYRHQMFYVNADKCAINEEEVREMQIQRHSRTAEAVIRRCRKGQFFYELNGSRCSNCWQLCALGLWVRYLSLFYDTKRLRTVTNKTTDLLCNTFPLFARESTLSQKTKTKLLWVACPIHSHVSHVTGTVSNSKCLRANGFYPKGTLTSHLHDTLNVEDIQDFIHRLTAKFFVHCPTHPNPLVQQIGN